MTKVFNAEEFNSQVKDLKDDVRYIISNAEAKNVIFQVIRDNNYDLDEVLNYLHETTKVAYPDYMSNLRHCNWKTLIENFTELDETVADDLNRILNLYKGKNADDFYRDGFYEVMRNHGINTNTLTIDMSLDYFGWLLTLNLILAKVGDSLLHVPTEPEVKTTEKKEAAKKTEGETDTPKEETPKMKSKGKKGKPVEQRDNDNKVLYTFSSVAEAIETLSKEMGRQLSENNIYQSCSKGCKAYGFYWTYAGTASSTDSVEETPAIASEVSTPDVAASNPDVKEETPVAETPHSPIVGDVDSTKPTKQVVRICYADSKKKADTSRVLGVFSTQKEACEELGIKKSTLSNCLRTGETKKKEWMWYHTDGKKVRIVPELIPEYAAA